MGEERHSTCKEKLNYDNGNNECNSSASCDYRFSLNGYKKIAVILIVFLLVICFRHYVIDRVIVSGVSMENTFSDGDVLWAEKYDMSNLKRYDVVEASIDGKLVIKRIIGLPNETMQIIDGYVYVNGIKLIDDYGYNTSEYGCLAEKITLNENEYFLMGDNRDNSLDCRVWGAIDIDNIKGKIFFQFFPFWEIKSIE